MPPKPRFTEKEIVDVALGLVSDYCADGERAWTVSGKLDKTDIHSV